MSSYMLFRQYTTSNCRCIEELKENSSSSGKIKIIRWQNEGRIYRLIGFVPRNEYIGIHSQSNSFIYRNVSYNIYDENDLEKLSKALSQTPTPKHRIVLRRIGKNGKIVNSGIVHRDIAITPPIQTISSLISEQTIENYV